jgi:TRAP-type C4-dicarboxylate transport system permease small subunit
MRHAFEALLAGALSLCRAATLLSFSVLVIVVVIQVLGRVPGFPSPAWTEEVARFALVWLVASVCGIAVLQSDLVNVDLFVALLPEGARRFVERVVDVIIAVFCLAIIPGAWDYVVGSLGERARSLDVPMGFVYAVTLVIPVSLTFFSIARLFGHAPAKAPADHGEVV